MKRKPTRGGKRPGAGRPATGRSPSSVIALRVTPEVRADLAAVAKRNGQTLSAWVWAAVLQRYTAAVTAPVVDGET